MPYHQELCLPALEAVLRSDKLQVKSENDTYWYVPPHHYFSRP